MLLSINGKVFSLTTKNRLLVTFISANNNDKLHSLSLTTGHLYHMKKIYNRLIPKIILWINAMLYCFPIYVVDLLVLKIFYNCSGQGNKSRKPKSPSIFCTERRNHQKSHPEKTE